jgi:hypothetical protein
MKKYFSITLLTFVLILFLGMDLFAVTKTSSQSGNWSAASTWGGDPRPVAGDDVIINGGFTVTVDIPNAACLSIQLGGSALNTGTGTLSFTSGSQVTVSGALNVGPFNSNTTEGSFTMASGGTLTCEGLIVGRLGTWTAGTGTIELTATNVIPNDNNVIFNNLTMSGGTTTLPRNVDVNGNLLINPSATLNGGANTLSVGGNWTNNGTFTGNAGTVTFIKNGNQTITGTGVNNFNLIRVNMGTSIANTLEILSTHFSAPEAFLNITNGTFKMSGSFTFANTFISGASYNIDPGTGFWINNPNVTVTAQAGGVSVRGMLRLSAGTYNIGTGIDNSLVYVSGSFIIIEGGALNIAGRLTRNNATQTTSYTQSGGTVTVVEQGSTDPTFAGFDLGVAGSTFTMSGGTIVIRNPTSAPTDYLNSASANVTGGTLQIGDAGTANAQTFRINSLHQIGSLLVSNATSQATKPTAQLITSSLNVVGNITIQSGTTLNANGLNISLGGDWSNSGTFAGGNTVTFNGSGPQTLIKPGGETFNDLSIIKTGGTLTLNSSATVNGTLTLTSGAFSIGANTLNLNGTLSIGSGSLIGGLSSNIVVGGSSASITLPGITLNNLTLNRANGGLLGGDITINGSLTIVNGTLNTGTNKIILGPGGILSEPAGQPVVGNVSTTRNVTATSGTESFGNIGADIALNGVALGSTTVLRKTGTASTGNGHNSIKRYFDITPATNTGLNAGLVFHYDDTELNGQNANTLELYRWRDNGSAWNNLGGTINAPAKTITVLGLNDFSRWTASDTINSIGNTATPTTTSIIPTSKTVGDPAFTLTVNGTEFVNGKSTVRFNGNNRTTTYINSTQLTASIPASDLLILGTFPVTVFNTGGGGLSNAQTFTVHPLPPTMVRVETAADGSGIVVPAQTLASGSSINVYAITRDSLNNFVENVVADLWSLENITGGVVAGDLVPAADGKSATFNSHVIGSANIKATSGTLTTTPSGVITVTPGAATNVRVETTADGSGIVVLAQTLESGSSITVYSITRDASDNFVANVAATAWTLENITGGVVAGDLVPAADSKSAVFTGHAVGSANIKATSGTLAATSSGTITVTPVAGVDEEKLPLTYALMQNYPNPFNPTTLIRYYIPEGSFVTLQIYDVLGNEIVTLVNSEKPAGSYKVEFSAIGGSASGGDTHSLPSGIYFYRLSVSAWPSQDGQAGSFVETKKMILLR